MFFIYFFVGLLSDYELLFWNGKKEIIENFVFFNDVWKIKFDIIKFE